MGNNVYLLFALFIIIFALTLFLESKTVSNSNRMIFGWTILTVLAVFCGFRFEFGGDWKVYIDAFHSVKAGGGDYPHEPLFRLLVKTFVHFDSGYLLLNLTSTALFLGFITAALYKYESLKFKLTNFLFFIFPIGIVLMNLGFIRQAIACSVCLLSYAFFLKKEHRSALVTLIIAQGFHVSAFIFVFYFLFIIWLKLKNRELKKYILLATAALTIICIVTLFSIRKEYIGGYKSDGLFPRILYIVLLSFILIYLRNITNLLKAAKYTIIMAVILTIGYMVCKKLMITSVLDRSMYYLILPICFDITRELNKHDKKTNIQAILFHFFYSLFFLIGWFAMSPYSKYWRHYKFWFF